MAFTGDVARTLVVAPNIAMMADGNQKIARKYMVAAKIPDSTGDPLWPDLSPDMLDPATIIILCDPTQYAICPGESFTFIVTVLAMAGHRLQWFEMGTQSWIELVLTLPIMFWAGGPFFVRSTVP